ncbi:ATP-binding protein [Anaeromassilibacillus senegalensis]|uniref:ATP-binding protein n=1 Tax=Anaeromassilibacillus senegalensis TaxID=1673717 RepID=UPI0006825BF0|nr:ATP-binding protein [Anaeromassilibacillus senegalensis]
MKKQMLLCNVGIILIGFVAAFLTATVLVQNQYQEEFTNRLNAALAVISTQEDEVTRHPQQLALQMGNSLHSAGQPMRITVLDRMGNVVGDSEKEDIRENHYDRPEIVQAREGGYGYDTRRSASVGVPFYYAAVQLGSGYYLRAALPLEDLERTIRKMWLDALLGVLFGVIMVSIASSLFVSWLSQPLKRMSEAAKKLSRGDFQTRVRGKFNHEFAELAQSFNQMADNTENAVELLRTKQDQLEGVLQGMNDGVLAVNDQNEILFLNRRACSLLDCPGLKAGDKLDGSLLLTRLADLLAEAVRTGEPASHELSDLPEDQKYTVYTAPMDGQKTPAALAVVTDVTRIRKLEQLRSEFVSNVTHELKTPLTSIRGSIELLKSGNRDEETRRYFYDVLDIEAERLHHLIDDMLVLSQIENAKEDPSMRPCSVGEALERCLERAMPLTKENQVQLHLDASPDLYVACTPTRLEQLFDNLITNAVKYNVQGGSVLVTAQKQRQTAVIRIRDTGIGIAKEHMPRLFERFYRVDTSRSREIGGTGLGLSIVKHLVALYGGEIGVESVPGKGTAFTVILPLAAKSGADDSLL